MATEDRLRLLKLALLSACADPVNDVSAQSQLRRVAEILSDAAGENLAVTLREILLRRLTLAQIAAPLQRPELKLLAYQVAVCICNADSAHSDPEHAFLEHLRVTLALDVRTARSFEREADAIIGVPLQADPSRVPPASAHPIDAATLARIVDDYAVLTGALAARAEPLALLAAIPLQMKMIYRIGKAFGHEPDRGQIKALMSTVGVEPVSQYVEACGKLILAGALDRPRTQIEPSMEPSAACFAQTYALGHVAIRVHGDGVSDVQLLHEDYAGAYVEGRTGFSARTDNVLARARQTEVNDLFNLVKQ